MAVLRCFGQKPHEIRTAPANTDKIALHDILGNWYPEDSLYAPIRFVEVQKAFVELIGIKHGVNNYDFSMINDSIRVEGMCINWPPYYCSLHLMNTTSLEISFFDFDHAGRYVVRYNR